MKTLFLMLLLAGPAFAGTQAPSQKLTGPFAKHLRCGAGLSWFESFQPERKGKESLMASGPDCFSRFGHGSVCALMYPRQWSVDGNRSYALVTESDSWEFHTKDDFTKKRTFSGEVFYGDADWEHQVLPVLVGDTGIKVYMNVSTKDLTGVVVRAADGSSELKPRKALATPRAKDKQRTELEKFMAEIMRQLTDLTLSSSRPKGDLQEVLEECAREDMGWLSEQAKAELRRLKASKTVPLKKGKAVPASESGGSLRAE